MDHGEALLDGHPASAAPDESFTPAGVVVSAWMLDQELHSVVVDNPRPWRCGDPLLGAPIGLLVVQPLIGGVIARRGSRPLLLLAPLIALTVVLPALAVDFATLLIAVVIVGAANGALDIAMNAHGVAVERATQTRLFTSLHAAFSFGALIGAVGAGAVASAGLDPLPHLTIVAVLAATIAAALRPVLGLANAFPLTLLAAEAQHSGPTGPALAAVSTVGYTGFLVGPPAIGFAAEGVGLRSALVIVVGLCAVAAMLAARAHIPTRVVPERPR